MPLFSTLASGPVSKFGGESSQNQSADSAPSLCLARGGASGVPGGLVGIGCSCCPTPPPRSTCLDPGGTTRPIRCSPGAPTKVSATRWSVWVIVAVGTDEACLNSTGRTGELQGGMLSFWPPGSPGSLVPALALVFLPS